MASSSNSSSSDSLTAKVDFPYDIEVANRLCECIISYQKEVDAINIDWKEISRRMKSRGTTMSEGSCCVMWKFIAYNQRFSNMKEALEYKSDEEEKFMQPLTATRMHGPLLKEEQLLSGKHNYLFAADEPDDHYSSGFSQVSKEYSTPQQIDEAPFCVFAQMLQWEIDQRKAELSTDPQTSYRFEAQLREKFVPREAKVQARGSEKKATLLKPPSENSHNSNSSSTTTTSAVTAAAKRKSVSQQPRTQPSKQMKSGHSNLKPTQPGSSMPPPLLPQTVIHPPSVPEGKVDRSTELQQPVTAMKAQLSQLPNISATSHLPSKTDNGLSSTLPSHQADGSTVAQSVRKECEEEASRKGLDSYW